VIDHDDRDDDDRDGVQIEMVAVTDLKPHPRNYREHPPEQIEHLAQSLREHDFYRPVVIARDATILAGHGITQAAIELGMTRVPVTRLDLDPVSPEALTILTGDNAVGRRAVQDDRDFTEILRDVRDETGDLVGTGYDENILGALLLSTRSAAEIRDANQAMEWVGLAEYEPVPLPIKTIFSHATEADQDALLEMLDATPHKRTLNTVSVWWPPRELDDPRSLRFVAEHEAEWKQDSEEPSA
jgi:hypothetical protein